MNARRRSERVGVALYLVSAGLGFLGHNVFIYTMVTLSRTWSGSDAVSGLTFFFIFFPVVALIFVAGAIADQRSRRALIVATQWSVSAVSLIAVALLHLGVVVPNRVLPLFALAALYGVVAAFAIPARFSFVGNLARGISAERVMVGLNVLQFLGVGAGPGVAAFARTHGGWAHMFGTIAVLCFGSGLLMLPVKERFSQVVAPTPNLVEHVKAGLWVALANRTLLQLFGIAALIGLCLFGPFQVLVPEFGRSVLALEEQRRGLLMFPFGFGLLIGGGATGALISFQRRGWLVIGSSALAALAFFLLPASHTVAAAAIFLLLLGTFGGLSSALLMASVNSLAADTHRGRVLSMFSWTFTATSAAGGVAFGALSRATSVSTSISAAGSTGLLLVGVAAIASRDLRRFLSAPGRLAGEAAVGREAP